MLLAAPVRLFRDEFVAGVADFCLTLDHVVPFADGGETSVSNLELRCRAHNQYEAELWFSAASTPMVREACAIYAA